MKIKWALNETRLLPGVGEVVPGKTFEVEDSRGKELIEQGLAKPIKGSPPADTKEKED